MRKDALGAYAGNSSTPNFNNFCADAVVFRNCIAAAPWTIPSHASFFTGLYPSEHRIHETTEAKCLALTKAMNKCETETLPEFLQKQGYETVGFSANYFVRSGTGFDRGFKTFRYTDVRGIEDDEREVIEQELRTHKGDRWQLSKDLLNRGEFRKLANLYMTYRRIRKRQESLNYPTEKGGCTLLRNIQNEAPLKDPFFLFANFMELHEPYVKYEMDHWALSLEDLFGVKAVPQNELAEIKRRYYLAAGQMDTTFGGLMNLLKEKHVYDESVIIVLSDHGQAFRERGYYGHGLFLYDELVEVPLIIKFPNNRRFPVAEGYQSLVEIPSLIKDVIESGTRDDALTRKQAFSESFGIHYQFIPKGNWKDAYDVRRKAIYKNGYKLVFNLSHDIIEEFSYRKKPLDRKDNVTVADALLSELRDSTRQSEPLPSATFGREEELVILEKLRALGYS